MEERNGVLKDALEGNIKQSIMPALASDDFRGEPHTDHHLQILSGDGKTLMDEAQGTTTNRELAECGEMRYISKHDTTKRTRWACGGGCTECP